jgi:hypothetical protein
MKRVVALLLIASVALFAAVAPQDLKVNAGTPMAKRPAIELKAAPLAIENNDVRTRNINMSKAPALAVDTTVVTLVYLEDFENGANGWTQFDGTAPDPLAEWHLDDFTTGDSLWWCGAYSVGGYLSNWYVALETPEVVLTPGDSTLSFQMSLNVEGQGGEPTGYDAWDGANVQISNDGGATWTVLTPTGVPYNATSLYSFGYIYGMGPGQPGWAGVVSGEAEVDLGAYIGDTVQVRFVFCSDGGYDGSDDPSMFGMEIDSINVAGDATYNGSVTDGLTSVWAGPSPSGSYWAVEDRVDSIPSPTHLLRNWVSGDTTFARLLEDYYVSPSITLPDEPATLIYCNFEFFADFGDEVGEFPEVDFWRLEVSPDDGVTWNAISNPDGDPSGSNFVYSQRIPAWYDFQYAYGETCNLTSMAGQTVKFRFYFHSDEDKPMGQGLLIDDFVVYTQPDLPIPQNVTAVMNAAGNVDVAWDDMNGTYQLPKSFWGIDLDADATGAYYGPAWSYRSYFGSDSTLGFGLGMEYSTGGKDITFTSLDFAHYYIGALANISLELYGVDTSYHLLYASESFSADTFSTIQQYDISDENITWNGNFEVWMYWDSSPKYPICYMGDGAGLMYNSLNGGVYGVDNSAEGATGYGEVTYSGLEYTVYRRVASESVPVIVAEGLTSNSFTDETANPFVEYEYTVACATPTFTGNVGTGSSVFVYPTDVEEAKYDDGTAEAIFELGMDTTVVVKITPSSYPAKLEALRFAALWAGDAYKIKVFKDDAGMPGASWMLIEPPVTAIEGWNTFKVANNLTVDNGNGIVLRDGESVWVGVKGNTVGYTAWLGADTDSYSGMSTMQMPGGGWASIAPYLRGNPMIRGYFDTDIDTTSIPEIIPAKYELAQNYPNPFNPVTTIHFELKETGMTTVDIFDITGRHVRTLLNGSVDAGAYDLRFDASALSSGVYFYRLTSGTFSDIKKMSLLK